jgi:hypothetical protein
LEKSRGKSNSRKSEAAGQESISMELGWLWRPQSIQLARLCYKTQSQADILGMKEEKDVKDGKDKEGGES